MLLVGTGTEGFARTIGVGEAVEHFPAPLLSLIALTVQDGFLSTAGGDSMVFNTMHISGA